MRHGIETKLWLNGVQQGATYTTDTHDYVTFASRPRYWGRSSTEHKALVTGFIDESELAKGIARWTSDFSGSLPVLGIQQHGRWRQSLTLSSRLSTTPRPRLLPVWRSRSGRTDLPSTEDPADIISDLMQTYALVPASYITLAKGQVETTTYLGQVYSAIIPEPTAVNKLIGEIVEQAALADPA